MKPLVSVLIPCRDQGRFLEEALQSVFSQTWPAVEVVVVNDGSKDETAEVIARWSHRFPGRVKGVEGGGNGQARARRLASLAAQGDYWITLDADDGLMPEMVRTAFEAMEREPVAAGAVGDVVMTDESGRHVLEILKQRGLSGWPAVVEACPIGAWNGVLLRAEAVRRIGGIGLEGESGAEDWDLAVRMVRVGYRLVPVRKAVAWYRQHPASHSRNPLRPLLARLELLERCRTLDPRLMEVGSDQPFLADRAFKEARNRMVFFALGVAAVVKEQEGGGILSFWCEGPRQEKRWAQAYAEGFAHGVRGGHIRPDPVPPDIREALAAVCRNRWGWEEEETGRFLIRLARAVCFRLFPGPRHWWRAWQARRMTRLFERMRGTVHASLTEREEAK